MQYMIFHHLLHATVRRITLTDMPSAAYEKAYEKRQAMNNYPIPVGVPTAYAQSLMFPVGEPNDAYAQYFTGRSWLARSPANRSAWPT